MLSFQKCANISSKNDCLLPLVYSVTGALVVKSDVSLLLVLKTTTRKAQASYIQLPA
jgi:hypothetical protein